MTAWIATASLTSSASVPRCSLRTSGCGPARRAGRRAAARGRRRDGAHVDRLLRAARAATGLTSVGVDGRADRPCAAADARRARPSAPAGGLHAAAARVAYRPRHARRSCACSTGSTRPPRSSTTSASRSRRTRSARRCSACTPAYRSRRSVFYRWFTGTRSSARCGRPRITTCTRVATSRGCGRPRRGTTRRSSWSTRCCAQARSSRGCGRSTRCGCRRRRASGIAHPQVGLIELDCQILTAENQTERLVVFTATPGTEDAERLALLAASSAPRRSRS